MPKIIPKISRFALSGDTTVVTLAVVATAVALAQAIVVAFILGVALPGAFDANFAFNTP